MNKLISIIMPVKNGEKYLKEAIDGIHNQKMNVEIILVNDGSTDKTEEIAKENGCIVINHEKSLGPVIAKNTGLKQANGDYIMFHDGDDVMNEGSLQMLLDALTSDTSASAVMGKIKDFVSPDCADATGAKPECFYGLFSGAVLMHRNVLDIIGFFNESVQAGEIIEWKNQMVAHGLGIKKVDIITTNRRIHNNNFGKTNRAKEFQDYAQILRRKLKQSN